MHAKGDQVSTIRAISKALFFAALFLFGWAWMAVMASTLDRWLRIELPGFLRVAGLVVSSLALLLILACMVLFALVGLGTPAFINPPTQLVAAGPYKFVRNPMYIGDLLLMIGFGLVGRSPSVLLLSMGLAILLHLLVIRYEEPELRRGFGDSYEAYCRAVNRWIPTWV